ncbi:MAG: twin-arginine translocase TatA/TatE family subunit [Nitrospirales bacterium]
MFGTMGFPEVLIILVIVLIIFGAGKLPQIGEGIGKALKGFKKEVHEVPSPVEPDAGVQPAALTAGQQSAPLPEGQPAQPMQASTEPATAQGQPSSVAPQSNAPSNVPYQPGPERTPGTTAALLYGAAEPQPYRPPQEQPGTEPQATVASAAPPPVQAAPPSMEERVAQPAPVARASYPALPPGARAKPGVKRPSAVVNKEAVARVQALQAARKQAAAKNAGGVSPQDMQNLGQGLGDALRTFRQAAADVRGAIEPEIRTLQSEFDSAQKEIEQSVESAKQLPAVQEDPPQTA